MEDPCPVWDYPNLDFACFLPRIFLSLVTGDHMASEAGGQAFPLLNVKMISIGW